MMCTRAAKCTTALHPRNKPDQSWLVCSCATPASAPPAMRCSCRALPDTANPASCKRRSSAWPTKPDTPVIKTPVRVLVVLGVLELGGFDVM